MGKAVPYTGGNLKPPAWYKGNIDLFNRPKYKDPETGSIMTVYSMTFSDDSGKQIIVPTIANKNGRPVKLTEKEAIDRYYATGQHLGKYDTEAEAEKAAQAIHKQQERYYIPSARTSK